METKAIDFQNRKDTLLLDGIWTQVGNGHYWLWEMFGFIYTRII